VVGRDIPLWLPRAALDFFVWVPATLINASRAAPGTFAFIALGVVLIAVARFMGQHQGLTLWQALAPQTLPPFPRDSMSRFPGKV
jgi:hypothetical protein